MTDSMIERVKTAIAAMLAPAIDMRAPYAKVMVDAAARAAIEAMREPTDAMEDAGGEWADVYLRWKAMNRRRPRAACSARRGLPRMSTDTKITDCTFGGLRVGDIITMPAPTPTRWMRFVAWVTDRPLPQTVTMVATAVAVASAPCADDGPTP